MRPLHTSEALAPLVWPLHLNETEQSIIWCKKLDLKFWKILRPLHLFSWPLHMALAPLLMALSLALANRKMSLFGCLSCMHVTSWLAKLLVNLIDLDVLTSS